MTITADFERGTTGSNILAADLGSATPWDIITLGTTGAITYANSPAYGNRSAKFVQGATPGQSYLTWGSGTTGSPSNHYGRFYVYFQTIDTSQAFDFFYIDTSSGFNLFRREATTGFLSLHDIPDTSTSGAVALPTTGWVRIEYHFIQSVSVGQIEAKIFIGANVDGSIPNETILASNKNTGSGGMQQFYGILSNRATTTIYMDNIIAIATSYPGSLISPSDNHPILVHGRGAA